MISAFSCTFKMIHASKPGASVRLDVLRDGGKQTLTAELAERKERFRVIAPGFVNIHTHAVLSLMRGIALDMGFAPAYTRGVPHGHEIEPDEAVALARLGALESLLFGSTVSRPSFGRQARAACCRAAAARRLRVVRGPA